MPKFAKVKAGKIVVVSDKKPELTDEDRRSGVTVQPVDDNAQAGQPAEGEGDASS
jgi:hypothetical protein